MYRDARINRIFEGTNEINRLLIPGTLLRRGMKGDLPLLQKAQALQAELLQLMPSSPSGEPLDEETTLLANAKKIFLMVGGLAVQKYQTKIEAQQEVLSHLADMMILVYAMESALLRAKRKLAVDGEASATLAMQMAQVFVHESFAKIESLAKEVLAYVEAGDMLRMQLSVLKKLCRRSELNSIGLEREIAKAIVAQEQFVC